MSITELRDRISKEVIGMVMIKKNSLGDDYLLVTGTEPSKEDDLEFWMSLYDLEFCEPKNYQLSSKTREPVKFISPRDLPANLAYNLARYDLEQASAQSQPKCTKQTFSDPNEGRSIQDDYIPWTPEQGRLDEVYP